jgi:hypothetical protein
LPAQRPPDHLLAEKLGAEGTDTEHMGARKVERQRGRPKTYGKKIKLKSLL